MPRNRETALAPGSRNLAPELGACLEAVADHGHELTVPLADTILTTPGAHTSSST